MAALWLQCDKSCVDALVAFALAGLCCLLWQQLFLFCCPFSAAAHCPTASLQYHMLPFAMLCASPFNCPLPCRSAPLVLKHSTELAQVIAASKQQAHLFASKAPSFTAAAHDSKTDLPVQAAGTTSQGVTAVKSASSQQQEEAQVEVPQTTAIPVLSPSPAFQSPAVASPSPAPAAAAAAAAVANSSPIKPRVLKPIAMARGSSAILGQPKRPALALPSSLAQAATTTGEAANAADAIMQFAPTLEPLQPFGSATAADHASAVSVPVTTTGATAAAAAATDTASPSVPAVDKPAMSGSMSQKPSAMGSAFAKRSRPMPQIRAASSTMFGNMPTVALGQVHQGPQAQTALPDRAGPSQAPDLAAVNRLRAQFTLPFATAPAEKPVPSAMAGKRQQPEGQQPTEQGTPGQQSATTGEGIRAVVDALQAEAPSEATGAQQSNKRRKGRCCSCGMPKLCSPLPPPHPSFPMHLSLA